MKLLKWCFTLVLALAIVEWGLPLATTYLKPLIQFPTPPDQVDNEQTVPVTSIPTSRLQTILMYLPFLGIQIEDVSTISSPKLPSIDSVSFTYHSNSFSVYQIDPTQEEIQTYIEALEANNMLELPDGTYVGISTSDYVLLVEEIHDLASFIESVKEVNGILESMGMEKVSLKFE
ncbi:MAG: hypothetical protein IJP28_01980 [Erysipelotrichales bacterium]|nr:hypothetical protein [Erysipelotrichales bacterium]